MIIFGICKMQIELDFRRRPEPFAPSPELVEGSVILRE
jgi:hypothetical protein